jgi:hypothetical protein
MSVSSWREVRWPQPPVRWPPLPKQPQHHHPQILLPVLVPVPVPVPPHSFIPDRDLRLSGGASLIGSRQAPLSDIRTGGPGGRGFHSSTFQVNLRRICH